MNKNAFDIESDMKCKDTPERYRAICIAAKDALGIVNKGDKVIAQSIQKLTKASMPSTVLNSQLNVNSADMAETIRNIERDYNRILQDSVVNIKPNLELIDEYAFQIAKAQIESGKSLTGNRKAVVPGSYEDLKEKLVQVVRQTVPMLHERALKVNELNDTMVLLKGGKKRKSSKKSSKKSVKKTAKKSTKKSPKKSYGGKGGCGCGGFTMSGGKKKAASKSKSKSASKSKSKRSTSGSKSKKTTVYFI